MALELVVSHLDTEGAPVLVERIPPGATSWTPSADECFAAGRYVWFLRRERGVRANERTELISNGLAFEVSPLPSPEELERSLRVIERYMQATASGAANPLEESEDGDSGSSRSSRSVADRGLAPPLSNAPNLADAAISGHYAGTTGAHVGVAGIVDSPDAAGLGAENTAGGADLVLAGPVPAQITETQWILDDASPQTFSFGNPSGNFSLEVDGALAIGGSPALRLLDVGAVVSAASHNHFGQSWIASAAKGLEVVNNQASGPSWGFLGETFGTGGIGVEGWAGAVTGTTAGVVGRSFSPDGAGGLFVNEAGGAVIAGYDDDPTTASPVFEVGASGDVTATSFTGDGSGLTGITGDPLSVFATFGGPGGADRTIAGVENLGATLRNYHDLTVPAGATLVIDPGIGFISATGTCDIAGTITAAGKGKPGGNGASGTLGLGQPGYHAGTHWGTGPGGVGANGRLPESLAVAGGGGGGGGAGPWSTARGGAGGGASSNGGFGGCTNCLSISGGAAWNDGNKRNRLTGGNGATDYFALFLHAPGAGGGGGAAGASGGNGGQGGAGGGVVYLECASLSFTGSITAAGFGGSSATGEAGGGGGGGGGVVLIRTREVLANSGSIDISGGTGGNGSGGGGNGGAGQFGFGAVVDL
jgi:hypothetical protein